METIRLDKLLSKSGFGTRREVKHLIRKGYVTINQKLVKDESIKVDHVNDEIVVDGKTVIYREFVYLMMNKPKGVISATHDMQHVTVIDLIEGYTAYDLFPIGRLDKDTTGLLLLSNDGKFAHQITSPNKNVIKVYQATLNAPVNQFMIDAFARGLVIDGELWKPAILKTLEGCVVEVRISEGKYHQIKRMFQAVGLEVMELTRLQIGGLHLDKNLALGQIRELTLDELQMLGGVR